MVDKLIINSFIIAAIEEIIEKENNFTMDSYFIGPNSTLDSIDIVQIIDFVEEEIMNQGINNIDLFEIIFDYDCLTFSQFSDLILNKINA
jgi:hypothetical protein